MSTNNVLVMPLPILPRVNNSLDVYLTNISCYFSYTNMVRNYKKKTDRQSWTENAIAQAIDAVVNRNMACQTAATNHATILPIPKTTKNQRQIKSRGKTAILTESPYKNELMESTKVKEARNSKVESKKRKVLNNDEGEKDQESEKENIKKQPKNPKPRQKLLKATPKVESPM
jgi:hypothetical protein